MDQRLHLLQRSAEAEPDNEVAQITYFAYRARHEGTRAYFEPLMDWRDWQKTNKFIQNQIIAFVSNILPFAFKLKSIRNWRCQNIDLCENCLADAEALLRCHICRGRGTSKRMVAFRLPTFAVSEARMEFNLIPGDLKKKVKPFLMARHSLTEQNYFASKNDSKGYSRIKFIGRLHCPRRLDYEAAVSFGRKYKLDLPTKDEWLHATSAGTDTLFYWGNDFDRSHAWSHENTDTDNWVEEEERLRLQELNWWLPQYRPADPSHYRRTMSVRIHDKAKKFNAYGLVDTIGNIYEWLKYGEDFGTAGYSSAMRRDHMISAKDSFFKAYDAGRILKLPCGVRYIKRLF